LWRRAGVLAAILVSALGCDFVGGGSQAAVEKTGDIVFVRFWGSVHVHATSPGSQPWSDATYQWQEVSMVQVGSGDIVQLPSREDRIRGTGEGIGDSPLFGSCTVSYKPLHDTTAGADEGISIRNEGRNVEAVGIPPWAFHSTSGWSGSFCHPPTVNGATYSGTVAYT
jgi:hypothetical protein